jgi:Txe/YoeB family toxin of Txe-Axe toxin-antitoxin module
VKSLVRPSFWRAYDQLAENTKKDARRAYALFANDPAHPSLRFKKLAGYNDVWSVRISAQYRAVGQRSGHAITWVWIGSHNDFDKAFG